MNIERPSGPRKVGFATHSGFGIQLTAREDWDKHCSLEEKLWPIGPDAMTIRLQNRAFQAGYERQYFGFHSLRSGFLTSALIKAGDDNTASTRVLEQTAIVARWGPYSAVQMKYVKTAAIAIHVANRLVLPDTELHAMNVIEKNLQFFVSIWEDVKKAVFR
ncbi:hypothetical protein BLNAU_5071 [Blattamonas nauphoetae]|uniref:Integrase n=1 Tax=Blattamonas nauphoetae TaxID=2049346 RepID=A0ABQ9Y857_9EUKA|nr:hypothetical protein BLNAU_5071 [Blattamonas nauphoetae]